MENLNANEMVIDVLFDEIADDNPLDVQFRLDLLQTLKDDIWIRPSRKSLDFLFSACVIAKDLERPFLVWNEYQTVGLLCNVLSKDVSSTLISYCTHKAPKIILKLVPHDDPHVCGVLKASQETFDKTASIKKRGK